MYLEIAAESGLLGLSVFLTIIAWLLRSLWRARHRLVAVDAQDADLAAALWLGLLAYLCTGVFLHLSYQRYYWFLVALAGAAVHVLENRGVRPVEDDLPMPRGSLRRA